MAWVSQPLKQTAKCPSCNWEWRDLVMAAGIGAFAVQRQCPRGSCRAQVLLVYHIERVQPPATYQLRGSYLGSILLKGQNEFDLKRALIALRQRTRLTDDDVELLVCVAVQMSAQAVPA